MKKKKIIIGLSGGLDSTTLLGWLLSQDYEVHCCIFQYGSKHGILENKAATAVIQYYQLNKQHSIYPYYFKVDNIFSNSNSTLMQANTNTIPQGHYAADNMKSTVVPGRNLIFLSIIASLAETVGATEIALGVHAGDHFIYPDCRPAFIEAAKKCIELSSDNMVTIITPFLHYTKGDIVRLGNELDIKIPFHLTRTCYTSDEVACGKCGSCIERLEAFSENNIQDTIQYA